jgi:serine phosphatase RsbU (regulator of sigma subunit)
MPSRELELRDLQAINSIAETLNRAVDSGTALQSALIKLLEVMDLQTGWIFLHEHEEDSGNQSPHFRLAASHGLPSVLAPDTPGLWEESCDCQEMVVSGRLPEAYTEIHCKRLKATANLKVHASAPLRSGARISGILNIAGESWEQFTPRNLALLSSVGSMLGVALERAGQYDALRVRRMEEQAALLEVSNQLLGRGSLQETADVLVEEIRRLLRVDACALLLPDERGEHLQFVSAAGWTADPVQVNHTIPIERDSGPGRVMLTQEALVVEDLESYDPTHWAPEWILEEGFRGHAIVPLVAEARSIGVLVLDMRTARRRDDDELRFLQLMANQGAIAVERARMREEEMERRRMEQELQVGRKIQLSFLPQAAPDIAGWEFAARNLAAREVGGDFYDFFWTPGDAQELGMVIADVSGKGVPAALMMAVGRTTIRTTALSGRQPAAALERANELLMKDTRTDLFLSAFYAILSPQRAEMTYTLAGHNRPLHYRRATGKVQELRAEGIVLGLLESIELEQKTISLSPGDIVLAYTDGVTEALNEEMQPFGIDRLMTSLKDHSAKPAQEILQSVLDDVERFTGGELQSDDLTLLIFERQADQDLLE